MAVKPLPLVLAQSEIVSLYAIVIGANQILIHT